MNKNQKPNAVERELDFVIVLNNEYKHKKKEIIENNETQNGDEITECCSLQNCLSHYIEAQKKQELKTLNKEKNINNIEKLLKKHKNNHKFILQDRITNEVDVFQEIAKYHQKTNFCQLSTSLSLLIYEYLYTSDFIIFINNREQNREQNTYQPLCMAFIKYYHTDITPNFLYISFFCSDKKYGKCGENLMNVIKHIATLLKCSEIRLESVSDDNTVKFYERNGFINLDKPGESDKSYTVDTESDDYYNHYYTIDKKDTEYKGLLPISGEVSLLTGGKTNKKSRKSRKSRKITHKKNNKK